MVKQSAEASTAVVPDAVVTVPKSGDEHHGIPTAVFFDNVPTIIAKNSAPQLIEKLSALSQRYRFFEEKLVKNRDSLEEKIAEVNRALKAVRALNDRIKRGNKKEVMTQFELSDGIYVKAVVPPTNKVCLWLGANIMVEYTHEEAIELLEKNLASAENNFKETGLDIHYLRDQLNTTDVNLSRVYNYHVQSVRNTARTEATARGSASKPAK